jgi:hypothetical protein
MVISAIFVTIFSSFSKYLNPGVISATNVIASTVAYGLPSDSTFMEELSI